MAKVRAERRKSRNVLGWLVPLGLALAVCFVHWPAADAEFNFDDNDFVAQNLSIRSFDAAALALLRSFPPAEMDRGLYRPLTNFSHALEWQFFEARPRGYFAVNVVLYAGITLLFLAFLRSYRLGPVATAGAAALFALHPVHTEVVDGIAGRSELLALIGSLGAVLCWARALYDERGASREHTAPRWAAGTLLCSLLALGSKESGAMLPALLVLQLGLALLAAPDRRGRIRRIVVELTPFALLLLGYVAFRVAALGRFSPDISTRPFQFDNLAERAFTVCAVYLEYLRLLFWPHPLEIDFYYERMIGVRNALDGRVLLGAVALFATVAGWLASGAAVLRSAREGRFEPRSTANALFIGATWFLLFLFPVSHVIDFGALMAERFLFSPSVGVFLVVAVGLDALERRLRTGSPAWGAMISVLAVLCLVGALLSHARSKVWRDARALWRSATEASPDDARSWSTLGAIELGRGSSEAARRAIERAHALDPADYGTRLNLAVLLHQEGRLDEADAAYDLIASSGKADHNLWLNKARLAGRRGHLTVAREHAERALQLHPNYAFTHETIAIIEQGLALATRTVEHERERERSGTAPAPAWYEQVAKACLALGDAACERDYRARATAPSDADTAKAPRPPASR